MKFFAIIKEIPFMVNKVPTADILTSKELQPHKMRMSILLVYCQINAPKRNRLQKILMP